VQTGRHMDPSSGEPLPLDTGQQQRKAFNIFKQTIGQKNVYQFDGHYYPAMSDADLAAIRERKLREYQRKLGTKESKPESISSEEVLNRIFKDRAWEVFNTANQQFPEAMTKVKDVLVKLASSGRLTEVTGEELFLFLRKLGLNVRLNTKINYASHGQSKSLEEKVKEELRKT
jgi:DNA-binding TFAR19-related protein (PDSD5 family)